MQPPSNADEHGKENAARKAQHGQSRWEGVTGDNTTRNPTLDPVNDEEPPPLVAERQRLGM